MLEGQGITGSSDWGEFGRCQGNARKTPVSLFRWMQLPGGGRDFSRQELSSAYAQEGAKPRSRLSWAAPAWTVWLLIQLEMMGPVLSPLFLVLTFPACDALSELIRLTEL